MVSDSIPECFQNLREHLHFIEDMPRSFEMFKAPSSRLTRDLNNLRNFNILFDLTANL